MDQAEISKHLKNLLPEKQVKIYLSLIYRFNKANNSETHLILQSTIHCLNEILQEDEPLYLPLITEQIATHFSSIEDAISELTDNIYLEATTQTMRRVEDLLREGQATQISYA